MATLLAWRSPGLLDFLPPLLLAMSGNRGSFEDPGAMLIGAYVFASVIALVFGFANVLRRDATDKAEIAACLRDWRALPRKS